MTRILYFQRGNPYKITSFEFCVSPWVVLQETVLNCSLEIPILISNNRTLDDNWQYRFIIDQSMFSKFSYYNIDTTDMTLKNVC